ncbi:MAG: 23S rRNA (uracil(1939)-C(5))-methyltransferase RlmD, partial [Bacilli bacterium]
MNNILNENEKILLTIKRIGINGEGIGYFKRQAVFVKGTLPGEVVEVKITEIKDKYAIGEVTKTKEISPERVTPLCPYYGKCGGCQLQHLSYEGQLRVKKEMVYESFERYFDGNLDKIKFYDTLGMEDPWHYRNKSSLPTRHSGTNVVVGMYQEASNHLIFIDECPVENKLIYQVRKQLLTILDQESISVYNPKAKTGSLRNIIIRAFEDTNEVQVTFVLTREDQKLIQVLKKLDVTSANYSINSDPKTIDIFGPMVIHVAGKETIHGILNDLSFQISPKTFFQLNSQQTIVLYEEILKACRLNGSEKLLDCYCGIGSIGMSLAPHVQEVRGIDTNKEGIADANQFAHENGMDNAKFYYGNILPHLRQFKEEGFVPNILVVDPPRKGIELNLLHYIQSSDIKRIVYVSCNPATLAKNINHLQKEYSVKFVKPIDMFPQTANI